ncbi:hypothetical protein RND71_036771 [Anisodus tanguticus]|uniref:Uncharacterized protein n=1 Tax=Anisodus tanguticus TaxID=243964 RepID=A0AAE1R4A5_9SOLA|nr:hypothetical protein RND71_036771 [Anisodus tanguticus]
MQVVLAAAIEISFWMNVLYMGIDDVNTSFVIQKCDFEFDIKNAKGYWLAIFGKIGTPICIPQKDFIDIGRLASIENNHRPVDYAKKGQRVAVKKMFGRHFEMEDELVCKISRRSIDILKANFRIGTPICIPQKDFIDIGRLASIENNHRPVDYAKKGQRVAVKIVGSNSEEQLKMFGRHFEMEDELVCKISRRSIDILKANFRRDLSVEDWRLIGTPICIPQKDFIDIGRLASIENNHRPVDYAKKGQRVAVKIVGSNSEEQQKMFGRHFEMEDELVCKISRRSIDILKANFRRDLSVEDWRLVMKLKTLFKIQ